MNQVTDQQIIEILRKEAVPALGCTEPVAVLWRVQSVKKY